MQVIEISCEDGVARCIYADEIAELCAMGDADTRRASHVEPATLGTSGPWMADMSPSGGPVLAGFSTRGEALQAEVQWLKTYRNL